VYFKLYYTCIHIVWSLTAPPTCAEVSETTSEQTNNSHSRSQLQQSHRISFDLPRKPVLKADIYEDEPQMRPTARLTVNEAAYESKSRRDQEDREAEYALRLLRSEIDRQESHKHPVALSPEDMPPLDCPSTTTVQLVQHNHPPLHDAFHIETKSRSNQDNDHDSEDGRRIGGLWRQQQRLKQAGKSKQLKNKGGGSSNAIVLQPTQKLRRHIVDVEENYAKAMRKLPFDQAPGQKCNKEKDGCHHHQHEPSLADFLAADRPVANPVLESEDFVDRAMETRHWPEKPELPSPPRHRAQTRTIEWEEQQLRRELRQEIHRHQREETQGGKDHAPVERAGQESEAARRYADQQVVQIIHPGRKQSTSTSTSTKNKRKGKGKGKGKGRVRKTGQKQKSGNLQLVYEGEKLPGYVRRLKSELEKEEYEQHQHRHQHAYVLEVESEGHPTVVNGILAEDVLHHRHSHLTNTNDDNDTAGMANASGEGAREEVRYILDVDHLQGDNAAPQAISYHPVSPQIKHEYVKTFAEDRRTLIPGPGPVVPIRKAPLSNSSSHSQSQSHPTIPLHERPLEEVQRNPSSHHYIIHTDNEPHPPVPLPRNSNEGIIIRTERKEQQREREPLPISPLRGQPAFPRSPPPPARISPLSVRGGTPLGHYEQEAIREERRLLDALHQPQPQPQPQPPASTGRGSSSMALGGNPSRWEEGRQLQEQWRKTLLEAEQDHGPVTEVSSSHASNEWAQEAQETHGNGSEVEMTKEDKQREAVRRIQEMRQRQH
jgi:hypothetical protein